MRAAVTGGAGFIGSHLIEALLARGDRVTCIERPDAGLGWLREQPVEFLPIGLDCPSALQAALRGSDVVFHLAALTEAPGPSAFYQVNAEGTRRVLRAAAAQGSGAPRVILLSSLAALGPCRDAVPLDPDTLPCPLSHYGQSKLIAESMVHAFADRVPSTILRFPSVYGPRERGVLTFFRMVQRGVALTIGRWDREISMLYVLDAVQALLAAAVSPKAVGRTYCVAHPEIITWSRFADAAGQALGRSPVRLSVPRPAACLVAAAAEATAWVRGRAAILNRERMRELTQARWVCDASRAISELGFRPGFGVERGTAEAVAWYREAAWL